MIALLKLIIDKSEFPHKKSSLAIRIMDSKTVIVSNNISAS